MAKKKSRVWLWIILGILLLSAIGMGVMQMNKEDDDIKVDLEKIGKRTILETVTASGKVYPEKEVKISSDVSGEIVELYVVEGDTVRAGQLLAKIDPESYVSAVSRGKATVNNAKAQQSMAESNIAASRAQKEQIVAQITNARTIHQRNSELLKDGVISQVEYDQTDATLRGLEANLKASEASLVSAQKSAEGASFNVQSSQATLQELQTSLSRTTIKAPVDGVVSSLTVEQGERVVGTMQMTGTELMRISNMSSMLVEVEVSENDILRVNLDDSVTIDVDAYPDKTFTGVVTHVSNSAANLATGTASALTSDQVTNFIVEVRIDSDSYKDLLVSGRPHPFRPGMSASVDINTDGAEDVIAVPIQAVTTRVPEEFKDKSKKEYKEVVFLMQGDSVVMRDVKTGIQDDEYIQITSNLPIDGKIVTGPYNTIADELEQGDKISEKKDEDDDEKSKWKRR